MESSLETINHSKHLRSYADLSNFCTPISTRRFLLIRENFLQLYFYHAESMRLWNTFNNISKKKEKKK